MLDHLLYSWIPSLVIGIILLYLEHRTGLFTRVNRPTPKEMSMIERLGKMPWDIWFANIALVVFFLSLLFVSGLLLATVGLQSGLIPWDPQIKPLPDVLTWLLVMAGWTILIALLSLCGWAWTHIDRLRAQLGGDK